MAIWVGGDKTTFDKYKAVLDSMGDAARYIGPIGAGSIAKLVHNLSGYILGSALAETFTMGVKAGLEPDALWEAVRQGALGRRRTFDTMHRNYLPQDFDPRISRCNSPVKTLPWRAKLAANSTFR